MTPRLKNYWFFLTAGLNPSDYPELQLIEQEELRQHIIARFYESQQRKTSWTVCAIALTLAFYLLCSKFMLNLLPGLAPVFFICALPVVTNIALRVWGRKSLPTFIRKELRQHGWLLCLHCGYNLQGQVDPRCPECGTPFDRSDLVERGSYTAVKSPAAQLKSKLGISLDILFYGLLLAIFLGPSAQIGWLLVSATTVWLVWVVIQIAMTFWQAHRASTNSRRPSLQGPKIEQVKDADGPRNGSAG